MKSAISGSAGVHSEKQPHRAHLRNTDKGGANFRHMMAAVDGSQDAMAEEKSGEVAERATHHEELLSSADVTQTPWIPSPAAPLLRTATIIAHATASGDSGKMEELQSSADVTQAPWPPSPTAPLLRRAAIIAHATASDDSEKLKAAEHNGPRQAEDQPDTSAGLLAKRHQRPPVMPRQQATPNKEALEAPSAANEHKEPGIEVLPEFSGGAHEAEADSGDSIVERLSSNPPSLPPASSASPGPAVSVTVSASNDSPAHQILSTLAGTVTANSIAQMKPGEIKAFRVKLHPEELGDVEVVLRHTGQETRIHISVSREATAEALRRDLSLLEDRLGPLLAVTSSRSVTIDVQSESPADSTAFRQDNAGSGGGSFSAQADGRDRRPSPDKDGAAFFRNRNSVGKNDQARSLQSSATGGNSDAGLVV